MLRNAIVAAALVGGMAASAALITLAGAAQTDFGVIRATRIQLVDEQGNLRAELYLGDTDNSGNFRLFDAKNRLRVKLGTSLKGRTGMLLMDDSIEPAVILGADPEGPNLTLTDQDGNRAEVRPVQPLR